MFYGQFRYYKSLEGFFHNLRCLVSSNKTGLIYGMNGVGGGGVVVVGQ